MSSETGGGQLFVVSAPSGTGKTTVVERLVQVVPELTMSRSYTSRQARAGERDGVDYNFVSRATFDAMVAQGEFLEHADVFGNFYGTGRADAERLMASGKDVVLVIDVQGAGQVRSTGIPLVTVFVLPPSFEVLEQRLRGRGKDSDYVVVNDDLDACVMAMRSIILAERVRRTRMRPKADGILKTFGVHTVA